jgi:hypothetical protein
MKLYTANFGVYGMVVAIADDIHEAWDMMKDRHPEAQYIKIERIHETIEEHEITKGFVAASLGDL